MLLGSLYLVAHLVPNFILLVLKVTYFWCHCILSLLLVYKTEKVFLIYVCLTISLKITFIETGVILTTCYPMKSINNIPHGIALRHTRICDSDEKFKLEVKNIGTT